MSRQSGNFADSPPRPVAGAPSRRLAPSPVLNVAMGEGIVTTAPYVITSEGFGSCVAIILYDARRKIGGLAHIMLPAAPAMANTTDFGSQIVEAPQLETRNSKPVARNPHYRYADTAIAALLHGLHCGGAERQSILAKMVGGAQMFSSPEDSGPGIGEQNIMRIRHILERERIPLVSEDVGGHSGRSVEFHIQSTRVTVVTVATGIEEI